MHVFYPCMWFKFEFHLLFLQSLFLVMPPKITGKALLERWRTFIAEHKATPVESGGVGHALAVLTRQKLVAGHLSRSEIAELNRLKRASRASSTNSGDAHPAVALAVGAEQGAAGDSGVEQPAAGEHAVTQSAKASASSSDSSGVKQPAAGSKGEAFRYRPVHCGCKS